MSTAKAAIASAYQRLENQLNIAILRAQECLKNKVPYVYGGKTPDGLDCSGLITHCIPRVFPDGTENQFKHLAFWIFDGKDLRYIDVCDIVFFAKKTNPQSVSHVGIVEKVRSDSATIIHSSQSKNGVIRDEFDFIQNIFRKTYVSVGVAKIRPFLFRCFLKDEINRELKK